MKHLLRLGLLTTIGICSITTSAFADEIDCSGVRDAEYTSANVGINGTLDGVDMLDNLNTAILYLSVHETEALEEPSIVDTTDTSFAPSAVPGSPKDRWDWVANFPVETDNGTRYFSTQKAAFYYVKWLLVTPNNDIICETSFKLSFSAHDPQPFERSGCSSTPSSPSISILWLLCIGVCLRKRTSRN